MLEQIKDILKDHVGKRNPITSAQIAKILGIIEDDTHAKTRELIFECARKYGLPLAACNSGYYLIEDEDEFNSYMDNLDDRIRGIEFRKKIVSDNYRRGKK